MRGRVQDIGIVFALIQLQDSPKLSGCIWLGLVLQLSQSLGRFLSWSTASDIQKLLISAESPSNCLLQGCPQDCQKMHFLFTFFVSNFVFVKVSGMLSKEFLFCHISDGFLKHTSILVLVSKHFDLDLHHKTSISLILCLDFFILRSLDSLLIVALSVCIPVPHPGTGNLSASSEAELLGSAWSPLNTAFLLCRL